jgi:hypothetical protein
MDQNTSHFLDQLWLWLWPNPPCYNPNRTHLAAHSGLGLYGLTSRGDEEKKKKSDAPTCPLFLRFLGLTLEHIFMVFLGSSCRETAKNAIKDDRKKVFFPQLFRPKVFDVDFPQKVFCGVFELPLLRNAQKRHTYPI